MSIYSNQKLEKTSFLRSTVYVSKQDPKVLKLIKYNLRNNLSDKFFYGSDFKIIKKIISVTLKKKTFIDK